MNQSDPVDDASTNNDLEKNAPKRLGFQPLACRLVSDRLVNDNHPHHPRPSGRGQSGFTLSWEFAMPVSHKRGSWLGLLAILLLIIPAARAADPSVYVILW